MNRNSIFTTLILLLISLFLQAQHPLLQSGPMLGYSEMREVMLWVQTNEEAQLHILYYPKDGSDIARKTKQLIQ
jgi:alkaline phosphatase D